MVHTIKKYERKDHGEHTTMCDIKLKMGDKYSFKLTEITCPRCKKQLLGRYIKDLSRNIGILKKLNLNKGVEIEELEKQKKEYEQMISEL